MSRHQTYEENKIDKIVRSIGNIFISITIKIIEETRFRAFIELIKGHGLIITIWNGWN